MKIVLSHPTGNSNVRAVLGAMEDMDLLEKFHTCLSVKDDFMLLKFLPSRMHEELLRRSFNVPAIKIQTHPFRELIRLALPRLGIKAHSIGLRGRITIDAVYQDFDQKVAKSLNGSKRPDAVYAYEDGAFLTFQKAKELGLKCVYDLPIAYWETSRKLLEEEALRLPEWSYTLGGGVSDSEEKLERKTREMELADVIVGPSSFVMNSIPKWALEKKQILAPFGTPTTSRRFEDLVLNENKALSKPLRVLFVGSMGQRKGLGDLFAAVRLLKKDDIELVIMGSLLAPMNFYKKEGAFTYEQGRPHEEVLKLMSTCDVLCLPSIVEGRALVMQEAMSQGLPLIITSNTGGEDLIIEGKTGFIVPIRSPERIAEKLSWFIENRREIPHMGNQAQQHAALYSWANYGSKITNFLKEYLSET